MQQNPHLLFVSVLFAVMLPVTVWGFGYFDSQNDRGYLPYTRSGAGNSHPHLLHLQTGRTVDGYYVRVYFEGLHPEDIQVYPRHNRLVLQIIQGDRYGLYKPEARRDSRWQMRFRKQLRLPYDADWARMATSTKNGILEIHIPRRSRHMPADPTRK